MKRLLNQSKVLSSSQNQRLNHETPKIYEPCCSRPLSFIKKDLSLQPLSLTLTCYTRTLKWLAFPFWLQVPFVCNTVWSITCCWSVKLDALNQRLPITLFSIRYKNNPSNPEYTFKRNKSFPLLTTAWPQSNIAIKTKTKKAVHTTELKEIKHCTLHKKQRQKCQVSLGLFFLWSTFAATLGRSNLGDWQASIRTVEALHSTLIINWSSSTVVHQRDWWSDIPCPILLCLL